MRRTKHYIFALISIVLLALWYTSSTRSSRQHARYMETLVKLGEQDRLHQAVMDKLHNRLREAAEVARERVNKQMGERFKLEGGGRGVEMAGERKGGEKERSKEEKGQKKILGENEKPPPAPVSVEEEVIEEIVIPASNKNSPSEEPSEDPTAWDPSTELTSILRRSPIILFSKTYCPHSAAAKQILTLYTLTPAPYIVELDKHPHGEELQAFLKEKTGRGTVPNVLVNGRSLGGGDEVRGLHGEGKLAGVLRRMGGKRLGVERIGGER